MAKPSSKSLQATNNDRKVIAKIGGHSLHAKYDSREVTKAARKEFMSRFEKLVDPEGILDPFERALRAKHARTAYFTSLGRKSGQARRKAG